MSLIVEIVKSGKKPKEKVSLLAKKIREDETLIPQLLECFQAGSAGERGHCMEALEFVSQGKDDVVLPYLDFVVRHLHDSAPRVKWEAAKIIGNVAKRFSDRVATAVPKLWENTKDPGTVVRWSAAYALTEIVKNQPQMQRELVPKFSDLVKREANNGVRNIYLQALKVMKK